MIAIYKPRSLDKADRLARFDQMNRSVTSRGGWVVSLPGDDDMRIECLPGSSLPDELAAAGYDLDNIGVDRRVF